MYLSKAPKALVVSLMALSCNILPMVSYAAPGANVDRAPELDCAESHQGQAAAYRQFQAGKKRPVNEVTQGDDNPAEQKKVNTGEALVDAGVGVKASQANNLHFLTKEKDAGELSIALSIVSALSASDQQSFALTSREMHKAVVLHRMKNDRRALETKPWVIGPPVGSMELYRFNAAVWHALKSIVNLRDELQGEQPDHSLRLQLFISLSMAHEFLQQEFQVAYPLATSPVAEFIASAKSHLLLKCQNVRNIPPADSQALRCLAGDPANTGERDLMRVSCYLNDTAYDPANGFWADTEVSPDRWSYLRRYIELKRAEEVVHRYGHFNFCCDKTKSEFSMIARAWDFILAYSDEVTANDIRRAIYAEHGVNSDITKDPIRNQPRNLPRIVELHEKLFIEYRNQIYYRDIYNAIIDNYFAGNYERELSLSKWLMDDFGSEVNEKVFVYVVRVLRRNGEFESEVKFFENLDSMRKPMREHSIAHSIACFAVGDFARGVEIHREYVKKLQLYPIQYNFDYLRLLHIDIKKFSNRIDKIINWMHDSGGRGDDSWTDREKVFYDSIFHHPSKNVLEAIEEHRESMDSDNVQAIDTIVLIAELFIHVKEGNWERVQHLASNREITFMY